MTIDILDTISDFDDDDFDDESDEDLGFELELHDDDQMSTDRAREITEAIRAAATATFVLLAQAHELKAHKALGYETWADYVQEEFDMSAQRSYQLLDLSKVIHEIESVSPEGTEVKLTEAQARDIKRELPRVTEQIKEALEDKTADEASGEIDRIVEEIREQKKADDKSIAEKQKALDEAEQDGYQKGLESAADSILENDRPDGLGAGADGDLIELEVEGDGGLDPEDSMNLYNFFNVLTGISSLPEPDDFVKIIPSARKEEVENQLLEAVSWLNRFQTIWEMQEDN